MKQNSIPLENIEITIKEGTTHIQDKAFFKNKQLKKIELPKSITSIGNQAFYGCENLEEIILPDSITKIGKEAFYNCKKLKKINLPKNLTTLSEGCFKNCHQIHEITIPESLTSFEDGAFANMNNLENIFVSPYHPTFETPDHKILIDKRLQRLILYANGSKENSYSLKDYVVQTDSLGHETCCPIVSIGPYAFAGAKNLKELTICSCIRQIDANAFRDCKNLKTLNVESISLFNCPGFHITDHGFPYFPNFDKTSAYLPFETVIFRGDPTLIYPSALNNFNQVNQLIFQTTDELFSIGNQAFSSCSLLKQVYLPKQIHEISKNAFPSHTTLRFENGLEITGLVELLHKEEYIGEHKLYVLEDGTYYIEQKDKITTITKQYIDQICSHSEEIRNNPVLFLDFMKDLLSHNLTKKLFFNGFFMSNISSENRKIFFENIKKEDSFALNVLEKSKIFDENDQNTKDLLSERNFKKVIDTIHLLKKYQITDPILYHKMFMRFLDQDAFEYLLKYHQSFFIKLIKKCKLLNISLEKNENTEDEIADFQLVCDILSKNTISPFIENVKKYHIQDPFLFSKPFLAIADHPKIEEFFQTFDANTKRAIKASKVLENTLSVKQNLTDLLTLLNIIGAFQKDPIQKQKGLTFLTEKIFDDTLPNGEVNPYQIVGDDIHRIFNFAYIREKFDLEFANFFIENYKEFIEEEREKSGFIERVYLNFREISKTNTSHKGSQRKLKVTMEKCRYYLSQVKFDGVTEETKDLATLIGAWFDENSTWLNAQKVYLESLKAPRNIFTKVTFDEKGNPIYSYDPKEDLIEETKQNFSYQWLPKQDYHNLILGKYCNCCAHIAGAGQGIMRASMILDTCQNLVIRNEVGEIIAKATIFINKQKGYGVFNTVETSFTYREQEDLKNIYQAFLRGTKAFIETYNKNYPENPITEITVGENRNTILPYLNTKQHPKTNVHPSLHYKDYALKENFYCYDGDCHTNQRLVLKK